MTVIITAATVDILQLWVNVIIASATVWALFTAIRNSKETAEFSRRTLEESQENRKDDVIPILQVSTRHNSGPPTESIYLKNVGSGPLFDFGVNGTVPGVRAAKAELGATGETLYYVVVDNEIFADDSATEAKVTYHYKDMYGRGFEVDQYFDKEGGKPLARNSLDIPRKVIR